MGDSLILIGASVRAAAFSALRAGLKPWCADLFGDLDLRQHCPVQVLFSKRYPRGFLKLLREGPALPWMYTGALENHRPLVRRLGSLRPLWGNPSPILAAVRSPERLRDILQHAGHTCPEVCRADVLPLGSCRWLVKPRASAAGHGIRFLDSRLPQRPARCCLQEFIEGESGAAIFLGEDDNASLLGVSRQLVGTSWLHSTGFRYCGNVGPWTLPDPAQTILKNIGTTLACLGLRGLFGVDFVLRGSVPWPVEVNPRYTASVEVLEYATGLPALALHRRVFDPSALAPPPSERSGIVGKAIYYAPRTMTVPADGPWMETLQHPEPVEEMPAFADIPEAGQVIEQGRPVLTFFARAADLAGCEQRLHQIASDLDRILAAG